MGKVGIFLAAGLVLVVYGGLNLYIGRRIFRFLQFLLPNINGTIYAVIYGIFALSILIMFFPLPSVVEGVVTWIGSYWMGIFVYLLLLFLMSDLILFLLSLLKLVPKPIPQNIYFYASSVVLLLTIGVVGYGIYHANQIKQVSYDIQTHGTTLSEGMKVVLISDLHLGSVNSEGRLEDIVDNINQQNPDVVCIAGDIFNDDYYALRNPSQTMELLQSIQTKYGVYGSLGNHDAGKTFDEMVRFLEESNIKMLNDEYVIIDERLALFGRVDPSPIGGFGRLKRQDIAKKIAAIEADIPIVVMDHTPSSIGEYDERVDLILSGHTHKGQIFPGGLITNAIFTVDYGHYQKDEMSPHVIVTSGVGTWGMPMRVGSDCEIVRIQLH